MLASPLGLLDVIHIHFIQRELQTFELRAESWY
jgi:hypothetical protein